MFSISSAMSGALSRFFGIKAEEPITEAESSTETLRSDRLKNIIEDAQRRGHTVDDMAAGGAIIVRGQPGFSVATMYDRNGSMIGKGGRGLNMF